MVRNLPKELAIRFRAPGMKLIRWGVREANLNSSKRRLLFTAEFRGPFEQSEAWGINRAGASSPDLPKVINRSKVEDYMPRVHRDN
ncbi:uncharacterized protein M6B38_349725 [Iris pallida]|uniref:Uncharacterized protein n=1 Tax=Iris pallida TaxID=29817 RepID=A0AAX6GRI2_IRIPA|nr:uncharacterized protein M6B38_349725 [Iris pallida]